MKTKICTKCGKELPATTEYFTTAKTGLYGLRGDCKECRHNIYLGKQEKYKEKSLQRYKENRDSILEHKKIYQAKNLEHISVYQKQYREKNRERIREHKIKKYIENRDEILKKQKIYNNINKEKISERRKEGYKRIDKEKRREYMKKYYKLNPIKFKMYSKSRNARKKGLDDGLTEKQWEQIKENFNHECAYCGRKMKRLEQEHFIPISKDGEYSINNILPACRNCNASKRDEDFFVWYPKYKYYSKKREKKILEYLNYKKENIQQLALI